MKVGIITIIDHTNIGNRLQNFAVQEILNSKGTIAETIIYAQSDENGSLVSKLKIFLQNFLLKTDIFLSPFYIKHIKKNPKMLLTEKFNKKNILRTKKYFYKTSSMSKYADDYDYFCAGSDQVWNAALVQNNPFFFMTFAPSPKTFSFSASMGSTYIPDKYIENYKSGLLHVGKISVRETSAKDKIKELSGRDSIVLLDPTLLISKDTWLSIAVTPDIDLNNNQYIATYFLSDITTSQREQIQRFADENNLKIIDINQTYYNSIGPAEFLYVVANASFVFTDSFHGTAFSVIFGKKFCTFQRNNMYDMSSRITTLLKTCNIESFFCPTTDSDFSFLLKEILKTDISHIPSILLSERQKLDLFLDEVFNARREE